MVTRRLAIPALLTVLAISACKTIPARAPDELPKGREPEQAISVAEKTKDPLRAAEIAWIEGNDRALARKRLEQGLAKRPTGPDLLLARALLSFAELDEDAALRDLLAIIEKSPESAEAELALAFVADSLSENLDRRAEIARAIAASHYLSDRLISHRRALFASNIQSRIDALAGDEAALRATVTRGGFITRFTTIGPLAPRAQSSLAVPTEHETKGIDRTKRTKDRGVEALVREQSAHRTGVAPAAGNRAGLYVMESWFELGPDARGVPLALSIDADDPMRVSIDGVRMFELKNGGVRPPGFGEVEMKLEPGWHRLTVAILAFSSSRPTFSLLAANGRAVVAKNTAARPKGPLRLSPPAIAERATSLSHPASADAWVESMIRGGEHALFASFVGTLLAQTHLREDFDRAEKLVTLALEAAPHSAILISADARSMSRAGLPKSLAQAKLRDAIRRDPTYGSALLALARSIADDSPDHALELADRAEKANPRAAGPHALRFRIYEQRGWSAEAARSLTKALALHESEDLLSDGASFYRNAMRTGEALELERRLEKYAEPSPASVKAASAIRAGELDKGIALLREAARTTSAPANHFVRIASLEMAQGHLDAALLAANDALASDPWNAGALRLAALIHAQRGENAEVAKIASDLRALGSGDVKLETFVAYLRGGTPGVPPEGSWLAKKLAIDPRALVAGSKDADLRWSRYKAVRLLERLVEDVRPDGSALSLKHAITRVMTKEAADELGEVNLGGDALPLAFRTLKADGRVIEVDRHAGKEDLSFSALAAGDAIEQQWVEVAEPVTSYGGYVRRFYFRSGTPGLRTELAVIVPKGARVWHQEYHGAPEPEVHEENDRTIYLFREDETPPIEPEPNSVPHEEFVPFVVIAVDLDRETALSANVIGLDTTAQSTWAIRRHAQLLAQGLASEEEQVYAIQDFIANEIGHGGAREPAAVFATRRGERTGLFIAMLRALGIRAELALARPGSSPIVDPPYPNPQHFGLDLVRITLTNRAEPLWARMDLPVPWLGKATPDLRGGSYVIAAASAEPPKVIAFREGEVDHWVLASEVALTVDAAGHAKGLVSLTLPGSYGSNLRSYLKSVRADEATRALEGWIAGVLPGARVESFETEKLELALEPLVIKVSVSVAHFMVLDKQHLVAEQFFPAPLAGRALGFPSLTSYLRVPNRTSPLSISEVEETMTVQVALPATAAAPIEVPRSFAHRLPFGELVQEFTWEPAQRIARLSMTQKIPARRLSVREFPKFREAVQRVLQSSRNRLIVPVKIAPANQRASL